MQPAQQTYSLKAADIERQWLLLDANQAIPGRLAAFAAHLLRGKHKPSYAPHMDCGDYVVIINAEKISLSGRKYSDKQYWRHTGYPGGIKSTTAGKVLEGAHPERVLQKAISRMMPRGPLARKQLTHLKIYAGADHPHGGQNPKAIDFTTLNAKNKLRSSVAG